MLPPGTLIDDKYEVLYQLGVGGFGAVYAARQKQFDRSVAVKILNTTLLLESEGVARFEREAKAIDALKQRSIVAIYGYGTWRQAPYMVMELIDGISLDRVLARGKVEPIRAVKIISQVFAALGAAHKAGVVHRDLKPSNIMLMKDEDGKDVVKIIDFGLAKLMPGYGVPGQKLTETGYTLGTCNYMAPEQAIGGDIDGRADIYATGCIFYEMLAGAQPFAGEDNVAIMFAHLNQVPKPISATVAKPAPVEALQTFLNNCMAKDAKDRYQNCDDAIRDLEAITVGRPSQVMPLSAVPMVSRTTKKRRINRSALVAGVVLVTAVAISLLAKLIYDLNDQKQRQQFHAKVAQVIELAQSPDALERLEQPGDA